LEKGFFVVLTKCKSAKTDAGFNGLKWWKADLIHSIPDWSKTIAKTIDAVIEAQKEHYNNRIAMNQPVPVLVATNCGPMASGEIVRFVPIC
jgi:hypothetical protein